MTFHLCANSFLSLVAFGSIVLLPRAGIYKSFCIRSLYTFARRISSNWILLLGLLLLAAFVNKNTASFSRLVTTAWAMSGWIWLMVSHVYLRNLLRRYRSQGGNSRTIVYLVSPPLLLGLGASAAAARPPRFTSGSSGSMLPFSLAC